MAYCVTADLNLLFGAANIIKYANADNLPNGTPQDDAVAARITRAIEHAETWINARLKTSCYTVPFTGTIPVVIRDLCAARAVLWLYQFPRGMVDGDDAQAAMTELNDRTEETMTHIMRRVITLDGVSRTSMSAPLVVIDDVTGKIVYT